MKIFLSLLLSVTAAFGASEFDLRKGIDLTGATNVTASQLNQLVDAGLIASTNKGGVIRRSGNGGGYWPDVTLNQRYTNFLWLDLFSTPPVLKTYVPVGDGYTNWVNAGAAAAIPNNAIGNAQLAANAVNTTNIATNAVTSGQINPGSILNYHIGAGAVSNINIADGTIQSGKLAPGSVLSTNIAAAQLLPIHFGTASVLSNALGPNSVANFHLQGQSVNATNIQTGTITSNQISAATVSYANLDTNLSYSIPVIWGHWNATEGLVRARGVSSVLSGGLGTYMVDFITPRTTTNYCVTVTPLNGVLGSSIVSVQCGYFSNAVSSFWIGFRNTNSSAIATPLGFSFTVNDLP